MRGVMDSLAQLRQSHQQVCGLVEPMPPQGLQRQPDEPAAVPGGARFKQRAPTSEAAVS